MILGHAPTEAGPSSSLPGLADRFTDEVTPLGVPQPLRLGSQRALDRVFAAADAEVRTRGLALGRSGVGRT